MNSYELVFVCAGKVAELQGWHRGLSEKTTRAAKDNAAAAKAAAAKAAAAGATASAAVVKLESKVSSNHSEMQRLVSKLLTSPGVNGGGGS